MACLNGLPQPTLRRPTKASGQTIKKRTETSFVIDDLVFQETRGRRPQPQSPKLSIAGLAFEHRFFCVLQPFNDTSMKKTLKYGTFIFFCA